MTPRKPFRPLPKPISASTTKRPKIAVKHDDQDLEGLRPRIWMDQFSTYRMHSITKFLSLMAAKLYCDRLGINIVESRVINLIAALGPMSTRELSEHSRMNRVKVSRATQSLVAQGMLDRGEHESDRRLIRLSLTSKGYLAHCEIVQLLNWFEESVCDAIGKENVEAMRSDINRMEQFFNRVCAELPELDPGSKTFYED